MIPEVRGIFPVIHQNGEHHYNQQKRETSWLWRPFKCHNTITLHLSWSIFLPIMYMDNAMLHFVDDPSDMHASYGSILSNISKFAYKFLKFAKPHVSQNPWITEFNHKNWNLLGSTFFKRTKQRLDQQKERKESPRKGGHKKKTTHARCENYCSTRGQLNENTNMII